MTTKTSLKTGSEILTKNFILVAALFFFVAASSVVLPAVIIANDYAQNQKVQMAISTPADTCLAPTINIGIIKQYSYNPSDLTQKISLLNSKIDKLLTDFPNTDLIITPEYLLYSGISLTESDPIRLNCSAASCSIVNPATTNAEKIANEIAALQNTADDKKINIILGTVVEDEIIDGKDIKFNSQLFIDKTGQIIGRHRKFNEYSEIGPYSSTQINTTYCSSHGTATICQKVKQAIELTDKTFVFQNKDNSKSIKFVGVICGERAEDEFISNMAGANVDFIMNSEREGDCSYEQITNAIQNETTIPSCWGWMINDVFINNYISKYNVVNSNGYLISAEGASATGGIINFNKQKIDTWQSTADYNFGCIGTAALLQLQLYHGDMSGSSQWSDYSSLIPSIIDNLDNFVPATGYYNSWETVPRIYLWGLTSNDSTTNLKLLSYNINGNLWQDNSIPQIANNNNQPMPSNFIPSAGYSFVDNIRTKKIHLWGKIGSELKLYIQDMSLSTTRWYDFSNPSASATYHLPLINNNGNQPLPSNFIPLTGYYFVNKAGDGKINLWGKVGNTLKLYVYDVPTNKWYDRSTSLPLIANNNNQPIPSTFTPLAGYYFINGNGDGKINLWGKVGDTLKLYVYDVPTNKWYDRSSPLPLIINNNNQPISNIFTPMVGYSYTTKEGKPAIHLWGR